MSIRASDAVYAPAVRDYLQMLSERKQPTGEAVGEWNRFFAQCDPVIRRMLGRFGVRHGDLDDCGQEVWGRLTVSLLKFNPDPERGSFYTWLYAVVHGAVADHFRRHSRDARLYARGESAAEILDPNADPSALAEQAEARLMIDRVMEIARRELSADSYTILWMRWIEGRSAEQVASALGLETRQVWFREHRAKQKLREFVTDER